LNFISKIFDKFYLKQWSIGIVNEKIEDVIRNKNISKEIKWIQINNNYQFFADPFIFESETGNYSILFEEMNYIKQYGIISQFKLDNTNNAIEKKVILDTNTHLSYPFIFYENGNMYVFPESSIRGKLSCYQYDSSSRSLQFIRDLINLPLLDSTILKHQNKYWVFSTMKGIDSNKKLYIFYADNLFGTYTPHPQNPVKVNINGSRPAGNFILLDGSIYRPAQGSGQYYGSSIIINKVIELSESKFEEEYYFSITPPKEEYYNFGIHTINYVNNKIIIDGLVRRFLPFTQMKRYFLSSKKFS